MKAEGFLKMVDTKPESKTVWLYQRTLTSLFYLNIFAQTFILIYIFLSLVWSIKNQIASKSAHINGGISDIGLWPILMSAISIYEGLALISLSRRLYRLNQGPVSDFQGWPEQYVQEITQERQWVCGVIIAYCILTPILISILEVAPSLILMSVVADGMLALLAAAKLISLCQKNNQVATPALAAVFAANGPPLPPGVHHRGPAAAANL